MDHRNKITLEKMIGEADFIAVSIKDIDVESFTSDEIIKRAVTMSLINIGELTNALTEEFRTETPNIKWNLLRRTRDKVAHHYIDLDPRITWQTVTESVPELRNQLIELTKS
ncbi:MAG: DUF86 domain-containing protein [Clostridiales Family XIII bacterium]|jgi:uncharacterized protein with HEPN domain|nr:DUF86 domain-containing protein [Clostridiales Family XIII bacterium]